MILDSQISKIKELLWSSKEEMYITQMYHNKFNVKATVVVMLDGCKIA